MHWATEEAITHERGQLGLRAFTPRRPKARKYTQAFPPIKSQRRNWESRRNSPHWNSASKNRLLREGAIRAIAAPTQTRYRGAVTPLPILYKSAHALSLNA